MHLRTIGAAMLAAGLTLIAAPTAGAKGPLHCGDTVTTSVTLTRDLVGCPNDGLVVGASGITIDLAGHKITGTTSDDSGDPGACRCGINDRGGYDRVTVKDGRLDGFYEGAHFDDAERVLVDGVTSANHYENAVAFSRASRGAVVDTTVARSYRGVRIADSQGMTVRDGTLDAIEHAGVALFRDTGNVVRGMTGNLHGGDYAVELTNEKGALVTGNAFRGWGADGIAVSGHPLFGDGRSANNTVIGNDLRHGSTGIELIEIDGGVVRDNVVRDNTIRNTDDNGILVDAVTSQDGSGFPPYDYPIGVGPSGNLIAANSSEGNAVDGIHLDAPGNRITANIADDNAGWGIFAVPGNQDGGGNRARGNGQPSQCSGVRCSPG